ncbi:hypothetical protein BD560DRAFT_432247 [Blakeslea trispora]|nr:hypothetical protein BD560DRAFT_432247 [Blakeslea trispora]
MNIPKKRSRTFVRPRLQEVYFPFDIHSSIPRSDVSEAYDPVGDGYCGFRSASFLVHGNEGLYPVIKQEMVKALKRNREVYEKSFGIDVKDAEDKITCGIDLITEEMKAVKIKRTNDNEIDEEDVSLDKKHPKSHRQSKVAGTKYWFNSPDCAQILADAVSAPTYVYPSPSFESEWNPAMTFLPLNLPIKQSNKPSPLHLQDIDQIHWGASRMKNGHTSNPAVNRLYFAIDGKKKNFQVYWNKWGQFLKMRTR